MALGVVTAMAATRGLRSLLFGVQPLDGATGTVIGLVVVVVILASGLAARRVLQLDVAVVLRTDG